MTFRPTDRWSWDFWLADDGDLFHLFFLQAPTSLRDPDLRHDHASVGHAVSDDLRHWAERGRALGPSERGFDDLTVWTGSVVGGPGAWRMFYTGRSRADGGCRQQVGLATSPDLGSWERQAEPGLPMGADPRWYELDSSGRRAWRWHDHPTRPEEHFRDPFAVQDASGRWHLYVTARLSGTGPGRGTVGHAEWGGDAWEARPPLAAYPGRFEQAEVIGVHEVAGRWVLVFSCLGGEMVGGRAGDGGIWTVPVAGPGEAVGLDAAVRLTDEDAYAGRLIRDREGAWRLLAFDNRGTGAEWRGGLTDPMPVRWRPDGAGLELAAESLQRLDSRA